MKLTFDFAFEGFRLIRERPKLIAFWGAITLFGYGLMSLIMVYYAGPSLISLAAMSKSLSGMTTSPDAGTLSAMASVMQQVIEALLMCAPIHIIMSAVLLCAICRAALGEGDDSLGYLSFGMAELRMITLVFANFAVLFGVWIGAVLAGSLVSVLFGLVVPPLMPVLQSLNMLVSGGIVAWVGLRLSFNAPQTFETQKFNLFGSFALTRGRFWPLFVGYALAIALAQVVAFLCDKVIEAVQVLSLGLKVTGELSLPDISSLAAFLTPSTLILLILTGAIVAPLTYAIQFAAPVAAYRRLKGQPLKPEDNFS